MIRLVTSQAQFLDFRSSYPRSGVGSIEIGGARAEAGNGLLRVRGPRCWSGSSPERQTPDEAARGHEERSSTKAKIHPRNRGLALAIDGIPRESWAPEASPPPLFYR